MTSIAATGNQARLGQQVSEADKKRLKEACEQFEAIFMQYLLKSMRQTVVRAEDPEQAREVYEAMMDETLAQEMASKQERGLAAMLYQQLLPALTGETSRKA
ncbi:rod-binding protein [Desulfoferrobacter suflitae]|uniref:rod-binding protein n=1 Tax=Desulfoferrobacter suflitae TaxID=2865782 RepID=UPI00216498D7|nr:rod-binding protein [Desulfoferrobacter suflitae]MCK8602411.1 rod-binding protein [Desulfoferrobacter suflitae]